MADTLQAVLWTLQQSCRLRDGDAVSDPAKALGVTAKARLYAHYLRAGNRNGTGILGDICVTSHSSAPLTARATQNWVDYPESGFVISEEFRAAGGSDRLISMCRDCPANATRPHLAGCCGSIFKKPHAAETEEQLQRIVSRLGLEVEWRDSFPQTTPMWFGMWTAPVPSLTALRLLRTVISSIADEDAIPRGDGSDPTSPVADLRNFVAATEIAEATGVPLRVWMAPPGHNDLGYCDTFAHCPFCKAEANLPRWKPKYPTESYTCEICGTKYSPAETTKSEKDDWGLGPSLRQQLGTERFAAFAREYLVKGGISTAEAARIVEITELAERQSVAAGIENQKKEQRKQRWIRANLMAGLTPRFRDVEETKKADEADRFAYLGPDDFAVFLDRCKQKKLRVLHLFHHSESQEFNRFWSRTWTSPAKVFAKWRKEGCRELFGATVEVPDELIRGSE